MPKNVVKETRLRTYPHFRLSWLEAEQGRSLCFVIEKEAVDLKAL
jgi:hypothetical protein